MVWKQILTHSLVVPQKHGKKQTQRARFSTDVNQEKLHWSQYTYSQRTGLVRPFLQARAPPTRQSFSCHKPGAFHSAWQLPAANFRAKVTLQFGPPPIASMQFPDASNLIRILKYKGLTPATQLRQVSKAPFIMSQFSFIQCMMLHYNTSDWEFLYAPK